MPGTAKDYLTPGPQPSALGRYWRLPGNILLISCYELGHQPLGIASPMAFLERTGYLPDALDIAIEGFQADKVARARFIGISVPMHTALRLGIRVAEQVRALNPGCHICFYGLYASLNSRYLMDHGGDSVLGGEYEMALVERIEALAAHAGGEPPPLQVVRETGPILERIPFPVPSRDRLPGLHSYAHLRSKGNLRQAGYVEASRGCLHLCRHCPIPPVYGGRFFVIPKAIVVQDIRRLVQSGATHITFGDPDFLNGPGHSLAIGRALHEEFPDLSFDCTIKIEHILKHRGIFSELKEMGCVFIVSAVESFSDKVLEHLAKDHTRADVFEALRIVRDAGLALRPSFVAFTPWTTLEDYVEMFATIAAEDLIDHIDPVQYTVRLLIPPGSLLLKQPAVQPFLRELVPEAFSYRWIHPDPRVDDLHRAVSVLVEKATQAEEESGITFERLWSLASAICGRRLPDRASTTYRSDAHHPPRLTEPWFC